MNRELRTFVASELRATGSDKQPRITGYAATFSGIADLGGFKEKIAPGAFTRTLADNDEVVMLVDRSFGFSVDGPDGETWEQMPDGTALRTLVSVRLFDTSVVTYPAYSNTSAQARNVVAPHVEARMAALNQEAETQTRRVKAQLLLDQIAAEEDAKTLRLRYENLFN